MGGQAGHEACRARGAVSGMAWHRAGKHAALLWRAPAHAEGEEGDEAATAHLAGVGASAQAPLKPAKKTGVVATEPCGPPRAQGQHPSLTTPDPDPRECPWPKK